MFAAVLLGASAAGAVGPSPVARAASVLREASGAPGAILGVRRSDGTVEVAVSGSSSMEGDEAPGADTPFFLGSITKTYTAALLLRLAEEGRLSLDDRLERWVPEYPLAPTVTLTQLLHQTTGFKDVYLWVYVRPWDEMLALLHRRDWTVEEMVALASRFGDEGWFEPGTDWDYSNTNALLLGVVAQRAGGAPYAELLRREVLDPLGLERTWLDGWEPPRGELEMRGTLGKVDWWEHSGHFGELGDATVLDGGNLEWAAGGLAATAGDALVFLDRLLDGPFLTEASRAALESWVPARPLGSPDAGGEWFYGSGLIRRRLNGLTAIGHGGAYNGYTAGLWRLEECDLTVVFGINRGLVAPEQTLDPLLEPLGCRAPAAEVAAEPGR